MVTRFLDLFDKLGHEANMEPLYNAIRTPSGISLNVLTKGKSRAYINVLGHRLLDVDVLFIRDV